MHRYGSVCLLVCLLKGREKIESRNKRFTSGSLQPKAEKHAWDIIMARRQRCHEKGVRVHKLCSGSHPTYQDIGGSFSKLTLGYTSSFLLIKSSIIKAYYFHIEENTLFWMFIWIEPCQKHMLYAWHCVRHTCESEAILIPQLGLEKSSLYQK